MSTNSDARVDTEDRDPYNAEPVRNDPWAGSPGQLPQDEPETERFVPEQRDSEHDGHLYASDTYAEPETEVLPEGKGVSSETPADARTDGFHDTDEPTAVGVAQVDSSEEPTAVTTTDDAEAKADVAVDEAEEAEVAAAEAREDTEAAHEYEDETPDHDAAADPESRPEPIVETVPLPAAEPVAVVTPVRYEPDHGEPTAVAAEPGAAVAAEPEVGTDDLVAVPVVPASESAGGSAQSAGESTGELKPGDVPVEPVAGFFGADAVAGLRERWREAQLGFVDDPRKAVDDVKALVGEAVDQFTASLSAQRDELDAAAGEDTEQYRVAVQRYRSFFDRLLGL